MYHYYMGAMGFNFFEGFANSMDRELDAYEVSAWML